LEAMNDCKAESESEMLRNEPSVKLFSIQDRSACRIAICSAWKTEVKIRWDREKEKGIHGIQ